MKTRLTTAFYALIALAAIASGDLAGIVSATAAPDPAAQCDTRTISASLVQEMRGLFREQHSDGALDLRGTQTFYGDNPVLATMSLFIEGDVRDRAFASQSASSIARYYQYLFSTLDRNGNLLIESETVDLSGRAVIVEDVGFNSLLALDLVSLSQIYLEVRKPMRALFWYEGSRTLQRSLVAAGYDVNARYFYPYAPYRDELLRRQEPLSALPLLFPGILGDNHRSAAVSNYLMAPARGVGATITAAGKTGGSAGVQSRSEAMLAAGLLVDVLRATGFDAQAEQTRRAASAAIVAAPDPVTAHERMLRCWILSGSGAMHDTGAPLRIFRDIVAGKRLFADNDIVRITRNADTILSFLGDTAEADADMLRSVDAAVLDIFGAISHMRSAVDKGEFFTSQDLFDLAGVAAEEAITHLFDDVMFVLRDTENELFAERYRDTGFYVSATLLDEQAVINRDVEWKWTFGALAKPVEIRSAYVYVGQRVDTLVARGASVTLAPGMDPASISAFASTRGGRLNELNPMTATLVLMDGKGTRSRYHAFRTVHLEHALKIVADFPNGRTLSGSAHPITIRVSRLTDDPVTVNAAWYSPAGLRLREGANTEFRLAADQDSVSVEYNILVPEPCRPGTFPFRFKFYGNQHEIGMIRADLFNHFQWLHIGPFAPTDTPLKTIYAPERAIDLYRSYSGKDDRVAWGVLGKNAYGSSGDVGLGTAPSSPDVVYIYTVIQSAYATETPAVLSSTVPAALFVNGRKVIEDASKSGPGPARARVEFAEGLNDILIKVYRNADASLYFNLGDENHMASDEFNNNLWDLIDGFQEFTTRTHESLAAAEEVQRIVTLRYTDPDANAVSVVGSFNGWSPEQSRMAKISRHTWEITISLAPGRYTYRFLVNNRKQVLDPDGELTEPDGFGGRNSVLIIKSE